MLPEILRLYARVELRGGNAGAARALFEEALAVSLEHGSHWLGLQVVTDLARCLEAAGDPAGAMEHIDAALARVQEGEGCLPHYEAVKLRDGLRVRLAGAAD